MLPTRAKVTIGKLDAARRQLETAITLWFNYGDPVSIHTLAFAAYEVIHAISKKRDPNRRDLIFDSALIRDEKRSEFNIWIKKKASFFKHADKDGEVVVEFHPSLSELFIMFCVLGVELCGERKNACEIAFIWWLSIERPDWLTERGRKGLDDLMPIENLQHLRSRPKSEFLNAFKIARAMRGSS